MYKLLQQVVSLDRRRRKAHVGGGFKVVLLRCCHEEVFPIISAARQHCPEAVAELEEALWPTDRLQRCSRRSAF